MTAFGALQTVPAALPAINCSMASMISPVLICKASSVAELMAAIEARLGVPRAHQRLWTCSLRENGSTRPDTCVTLARADVPQPLEATVESLAGVNGVLQGGAAHPPKQKAAELKLLLSEFMNCQ